MKTNELLQKDVQDAIRWEPLLNDSKIDVHVAEGVVTLTGNVDSYAKKMCAEHAAKSVSGVLAIVENVVVKFGGYGNKSDGELAKDILSALKWNWEIPNEKVKVKVEEGWVTLDGETEWNYQKEAAQKSITKVEGIKGITNSIVTRSQSLDEVELLDIENALKRNWSVSDADIKVSVTGSEVTLTGNVGSLYARDEAGRIAWNAPGVWAVNNYLLVKYYGRQITNNAAPVINEQI